MQEYTCILIGKNNFPVWVRNRIYSDTILISLLYAFFSAVAISPISSFRPGTCYGIGLKYKCDVEDVVDFLIGKRDTWFIGVSSDWKNRVIQEVPFYDKHLLRCTLKKKAWAGAGDPQVVFKKVS